MTKKIAAICALASTMLMTACTEPSAEEKEKNKLPFPVITINDADGWKVARLYRYCDGTTLLYVRDDSRSGIAAIPNSALCPAT